MRVTALRESRRGWSARGRIVSQGASLPAPVGGWDAISPLSEMPPVNAVELTNWFPQAGYVGLRRGSWPLADTGSGQPVESLMAYQGPTVASNKLFAASGSQVYEVSTGVSSSVLSGLTNAQWQHVNIATSGGAFLWMCNGADTPRYWNGAAWTTAVITGVTAANMVHVTSYRGRLWTVLKGTTNAAYLPADSVQGAATVFPVGAQFKFGGELVAIGSWSTDTVDGPDEFIAFVSSYGEVAVYFIGDPATAATISYRGTARLGSPLGRRCLARIGADLMIVSNDGVIPLSQALSYDRTALMARAITKNIQPVVADAARDYGAHFGWELQPYPRGTMAILNVPIVAGEDQEQFVMNTVTGAWCRFRGMKSNCWEVFEDLPFFGGNDGVVYQSDRGGLDADGTLSADLRCAFSYYGERGRLKRWTMVRPLVNTDGRFDPALAVNVDFRSDGPLSVIPTPDVGTLARWDEFDWDEAMWPPEETFEAFWVNVAGMGYCASIRMRVDVVSADPSEEAPEALLRVMGLDSLFETGDFI